MLIMDEIHFFTFVGSHIDNNILLDVDVVCVHCIPSAGRCSESPITYALRDGSINASNGISIVVWLCYIIQWLILSIFSFFCFGIAAIVNFTLYHGQIFLREE